MVDIKHRFVTVNGVRHHVAEAGSGPPLVLLHGWPEFWATWEPIFARLASRYRLIAPDFRGFGESENPHPDPTDAQNQSRHCFGARRPGGVENRERDLEPPKGHEVLVRQTAIGVNYVDIYHRKGVYPLPYPSGLGVEAAGVVEAVGEQVSFVKRGDRVAYSGLPGGACVPNPLPREPTVMTVIRNIHFYLRIVGVSGCLLRI